MKKLKIFLLLSLLICFGFAFSFEVHASGSKLFEVDDVLPATTQLKISWDNTFNFTYSLDNIKDIYTSGYAFRISVGDDRDLNKYDFWLKISPFGYTNIVRDSVWQSPYSEYGGSGQSYIIVDISHLTQQQRTITYADTINGLYWEDVDPIYEEGYSDGYESAREYYGLYEGGNWFTADQVINIGFESARELYGYYDFTTDEWLSVSEYLERYGTGNGTDPTDSSNFYANFDKYFIPAMIIVFGGAIVLTILNVFKRRE